MNKAFALFSVINGVYIVRGNSVCYAVGILNVTDVALCCPLLCP